MTDDGAIARRQQPARPRPSGKVYMVWLQRPGRRPSRRRRCSRRARDGSATASVTGDLDDVEAVLVNTEPLGGSTTPTSEPSC